MSDNESDKRIKRAIDEVKRVRNGDLPRRSARELLKEARTQCENESTGKA